MDTVCLLPRVLGPWGLLRNLIATGSPWGMWTPESSQQGQEPRMGAGATGGPPSGGEETAGTAGRAM